MEVSHAYQPGKNSKDGKINNNPVPHKWRPPMKEIGGKRSIYGKPHTQNNNSSWKLDYSLNSCLQTSGDITAAAAIASIEQKSAGAALNAIAATTKVVRFSTTIGDNVPNN